MSSFKDLPPAVQEQIKQMQNLQTQIQTIKSQMELSQGRLNEIKTTLKEITDLGDEEQLFKSVGQVMFTSKAGKIKSELNEELELIELKINSLKKQEERGKNQLNELNKTITNQLNIQ